MMSIVNGQIYSSGTGTRVPSAVVMVCLSSHLFSPAVILIEFIPVWMPKRYPSVVCCVMNCECTTSFSW